MKRAPRAVQKRSRLYKPRGSVDAVQNPAAASNCTDSTIDGTVQPTIVEVNIQDFRAKMKAFCEGEPAVLVGGAYRCRAIVLPVRAGWQFRYEEPPAKRARLHALLSAALDRVLR